MTSSETDAAILADLIQTHVRRRMGGGDIAANQLLDRQIWAAKTWAADKQIWAGEKLKWAAERELLRADIRRDLTDSNKRRREDDSISPLEVMGNLSNGLVLMYMETLIGEDGEMNADHAARVNTAFGMYYSVNALTTFWSKRHVVMVKKDRDALKAIITTISKGNVVA